MAQGKIKSDEVKKAVRELYDEGLNQSEIAEKLNINRQTVMNILNGTKAKMLILNEKSLEKLKKLTASAGMTESQFIEMLLDKVDDVEVSIKWKD